MTKRIHRLLSLLICLLLVCPAARAAGDKVIGVEGKDGFTGSSVYETCVIGNEVWMRSSGDVAVYDAQTGETAHYPWSDEYNAKSLQIHNGAKQWRSIECMFAWRGEAYVLLASSRSGQDFYEYDGLSLQRVVIADGQADLAEVGPVDWEPLDQGGYLQIDRCLAIGDTLYVQYDDGSMGDFALAAIPLDGSSTAVVQARSGECCGLCLYEGELLALVYDYDHKVTYFDLLDLESLTFRDLGRLEDRRSLYCPAQEKDGTRVLVTDMKNSQVIAWDPSNGQTQEIAPLSVNVNQAQGFLTDSGVYVAGSFEGVALIPTVDRVQAETELVVCDGSYAEVVDRALLAFPESHPEVTVRKTDGAENVLEQLMARTGDVDVYVMGLGYGDAGNVAAVMNRQWGAPIDSEVITAYVADMYPAIAQACTGEDGVFMVPLSATVTGQSIGRAALEALNLTIDDVPTSWPEFLDFLDGLAEDEGTVPLAYWSSTKEAYADLALRILNTYQLTIQAGINQDYDTPELRAALEALDRLDLEKIVTQNAGLYAEEHDERVWQDEPLFASDGCAVDGCTFNDSYHLMLSMTVDRPASLPVSGAIAIINPASEHIEEAAAFLEECVGQIDKATCATLSPHQGEPTRSANFETRKEEQRQKVESLEAQLAQAAAIDKPVIQQDLDSAKSWYDEMDSYFWDVSPQSLEWYRAHDDDVRLDVNVDLTEMRLYSLLTELSASGEGRTDALIAELQRQAVMRRLEQEG